MERRAIEPDLSHLAEQPKSINPKKDSESGNSPGSVRTNANADENSVTSSEGESKQSGQSEPDPSMSFNPKRPTRFLWLCVSHENGMERTKGLCFYLLEYENNNQEISATNTQNPDQPEASQSSSKKTPLQNLTRYLIKLTNDHPVSSDDCLLSDEEFTLLKAFLLRKFPKQANQL